MKREHPLFDAIDRLDWEAFDEAFQDAGQPDDLVDLPGRPEGQTPFLRLLVVGDEKIPDRSMAFEKIEEGFSLNHFFTMFCMNERLLRQKDPRGQTILEAIPIDWGGGFLDAAVGLFQRGRPGAGLDGEGLLDLFSSMPGLSLLIAAGADTRWRHTADPTDPVLMEKVRVIDEYFPDWAMENEAALNQADMQQGLPKSDSSAMLSKPRI